MGLCMISSVCVFFLLIGRVFFVFQERRTVRERERGGGVWFEFFPEDESSGK